MRLYHRIVNKLNRQRRKLTGANKAHQRILTEVVNDVFKAGTADPVCVETGCVRSLTAKTKSTLGIASALAGRGRFYTFEISPEHIAVCKEVCKDFNEHIQYVEGDSVANLKRLVDNGDLSRVDIAFLDSANDGDHIWREFEVLEPTFVTGSMLVVDDVLWAEKGKVISPYLKQSELWNTQVHNVENGILVAERL